MNWLLLVGFLLVLREVVVGLGSAAPAITVVPWVQRSAQSLQRAAFDTRAEGIWLHGSGAAPGSRIYCPPLLVDGPKVGARSP